MKHLTAIILAAGTSSRMGPVNKLLSPFGDGVMLEAVLQTTLAAGADETLLVTGYERDRVEKIAVGHSLRVVYNGEYREGMAASIRAGVRASALETDGFAICLGDTPHIREDTLPRLFACFDSAAPGTIVRPCFEGRVGHPVIFGGCYREELLGLRGDVGARSVIKRFAGFLCEVSVEDAGVLLDVDE